MSGDSKSATSDKPTTVGGIQTATYGGQLSSDVVDQLRKGGLLDVLPAYLPQNQPWQQMTAPILQSPADVQKYLKSTNIKPVSVGATLAAQQPAVSLVGEIPQKTQTDYQFTPRKGGL